MGKTPITNKTDSLQLRIRKNHQKKKKKKKLFAVAQSVCFAGLMQMPFSSLEPKEMHKSIPPRFLGFSKHPLCIIQTEPLANRIRCCCRNRTVVRCKIWWHTSLTQNCIFSNKNHQNPEHSIIFPTHQQTYSHINEINPATKFYGKITGRCTLCTSLTDSVQLRTLFADHARLTASQIISQQYCELQGSCKWHLSHQGCRKGHFSWYAFLNVWKCLLFARDGFVGAQSIESAVLSLEHETFSQMSP